MIRCSAFAFPTTQVRVWVDTYLHPLSVKLWDIEDNKRVLDWCNASTGLDCVLNKKVKKWQRESYGKDARAKLHMQVSKLSYDLERSGNRMNSPNQVKATGRGSKVGKKR
jgi:trans-aconitate methyltransferase